MKKPDGFWDDDANVLEEGRKYATRSEFAEKNQTACAAARKRGLLDQLYSKQHRVGLSNAQLIGVARKYPTKSAFFKADPSALSMCRKRGLLDQIFPKTKWDTDEAVLAEARKHRSRGAFCRDGAGAYEAARRRCLLDQIDWSEGAGGSDNDAIYIWRAVGQHYNGNPVYKIGVTSARLGTRRVEEGSRKSGFEFDLICCEPVQCKATDLERKLHLFGEDPGFVGFAGCTEFRALSDSALYAAISLICNQL